MLDPAREWNPSWRFLVFSFALLLPVMLAFLGTRPVARTQESRVLETARQMLGQGLHAKIYPQLNGDTRVRKPPVNYWLTALSFTVLGISDFAGRLPTALLAWLSVGVTFLLTRELFGSRAGFFAGMALAGNVYFYRFGVLAETDTGPMLGTVLAVYGIVMGTRALDRRWIGWMLLSAVGIALSAMTKGAPAFFAIVFLLAFAIATRSVKPIVRWTLSGAPLLAALLGGTWWLLILREPGAWQVTQEIERMTGGGNHSEGPVFYFGQMMVGMLPWSGLMIIACVSALFDWRRDPHLLVPLMYWFSVGVPLTCMGNKQSHYLLPLLPAVAMLIGWQFDRVLQIDAPALARRLVTTVVQVTAAALIVMAIVVPIAAWWDDAVVARLDLLACGVLAALGAGVLALMRTTPWRGYVLLTLGTVPLMSVLVQGWFPSRDDTRPRELAASIRSQFGERPMVFGGIRQSLVLCWSLRRAIPNVHTDAALHEFLARHPDGLIIDAKPEQQDRGEGAFPLPAMSALQRIERPTLGEDEPVFYQAASAAGSRGVRAGGGELVERD